MNPEIHSQPKKNIKEGFSRRMYQASCSSIDWSNNFSYYTSNTNKQRIEYKIDYLEKKFHFFL